MHQTKIDNREQRNNLDPVSPITFPCPNINVEKTFIWQSFKSILDNIYSYMLVWPVYSIHILLQPVIMWNSALQWRTQPLSWLGAW